MPAPEPPATSPPPAGGARRLGRLELRRLLGRSASTMAWLAFDPRIGQELVLTLPRAQPPTPEALERWQEPARRAARLDHPNLAHVVETGVEVHWPYLAYDRALGLTLPEAIAARRTLTPLEATGWICQLLQGLAFAHEAGIAHGDLQLHHVVVSDAGQVRLMGLAAGSLPDDPDDAAGAEPPHARRLAAERDVLCAGLLLHALLAGEPPLGEPDTARVLARMSPLGREGVRLPWTTRHAVAEPLRAIVNRATAHAERQRYRNARTLLRALEGWRAHDAADTGGPIGALLDRLRANGTLPAMPGVGARVARLGAHEAQRTDEMAAQILQDVGLTVELLRQVNGCGTQVAGSGPVLTVRRAVALLGVNGVRHAANGLRLWPGPLAAPAAEALQRLVGRVRLAAHAAQALSPAGYDPEVVFVVCLLQNLGRLLLHYHCPDEAQQVWHLMQPIAPPADAEPGTPPTPGMAEAAASYAVLGVDIEAIGAAVARHWGLGDEVQLMIRRASRERAVHAPDSDAEVLRAAASAANEAVDALALLPAERLGPALAHIASRYARALDLTPRDLQHALHAARSAAREGHAAPPAVPEPEAPRVATLTGSEAP